MQAANRRPRKEEQDRGRGCEMCAGALHALRKGGLRFPPKPPGCIAPKPLHFPHNLDAPKPHKVESDGDGAGCRCKWHAGHAT